MADCFEEYIDRRIFIAEKRKQYCVDCNRRKGMKNGKLRFCYDIGEAPCRACEINDMLNDVEDFPSADVAPVRHGRWDISRTDYGWNGVEFPTHSKCSLCGMEIPYQDQNHYCPNCGAHMDKEDTDGKTAD